MSIRPVGGSYGMANYRNAGARSAGDKSETDAKPQSTSPVARDTYEAADAGSLGVNFNTGNGDVGGTYTAESRQPFSIDSNGRTKADVGRAIIDRTLEDTATSTQIQKDEFEIIRHDNGKYTVVLAGVTDLSSPNLGLNKENRTPRDVDQFAVESSKDSTVESNRYATMVREYVLENVPTGADVMIVGHSYGADTALDLAGDTVFNNEDTGVNVTHVVAAAYFSQPQLSNVPTDTDVLVLQNTKDVPVIAEGAGHLLTEAEHFVDRNVQRGKGVAGGLIGLGHSVLSGDGGAIIDTGINAAQRIADVRLPSMPEPAALALLQSGVSRPTDNTIVARFDGGLGNSMGHGQEHYQDFVNNSDDASLNEFYQSIADYSADGDSFAVDISIPETVEHRTTYPGQSLLDRGGDIWNRIPGTGFAGDAVISAARSGASIRDTARDAGVDIWDRIPGNNLVEEAVGSGINKLPFDDAISASTKALGGRTHVELDQDAIEQIKADPGFQRVERDLVSKIEKRLAYSDEVGPNGLSIPLKDLDSSLGVQLGGARTSPWLSRSGAEQALEVAANELTWVLRHAGLDGTAHVSPEGDITINYEINDVLDLRPGDGRSAAYNAVTAVTGAVWHDVLGAKEPTVTGSFSTNPISSG